VLGVAVAAATDTGWTFGEACDGGAALGLQNEMYVNATGRSHKRARNRKVKIQSAVQLD
jgi:hypothetical protein